MKRALTVAIAAVGIMMASISESSAHPPYYGGRTSGFAISVNAGSPYGYRTGPVVGISPYRARYYSAPPRLARRSYYGPVYGTPVVPVYVHGHHGYGCY